jgi:preprotein translocase subunit SecA
MNMIEKNITLQILDQVWKEHLQILEYMRHTIVLRAYGQKDPLNEYKREAFYLFSGMIGNMRERVTQFLAHVELAPEAMQKIEASRRQEIQTTARHDSPGDAFSNVPESRETNEALERSPFRYTKAEEIDPKDPSTWGKVSRNTLCPCGSGKKYKHCHGAIS